MPSVSSSIFLCIVSTLKSISLARLFLLSLLIFVLNEPIKICLLSLSRAVLSAINSKSMLLILCSLRVFSSFFWLIPSLFLSCQTKISLNALSLLSKMPSLLSSKSFKAWAPFLANSPFFSFVKLPNNSAPLVILPSPSISLAKMPSLLFTQLDLKAILSPL